MADITNDNEAGPPAIGARPDAHGQAALLLVESLIHTLIERSAISADDAVELVDVASDVIGEIAADLGDSPELVQPSQTLLAAIHNSLKNGY